MELIAPALNLHTPTLLGKLLAKGEVFTLLPLLLLDCWCCQAQPRPVPSRQLCSSPTLLRTLC